LVTLPPGRSPCKRVIYLCISPSFFFLELERKTSPFLSMERRILCRRRRGLERLCFLVVLTLAILFSWLAPLAHLCELFSKAIGKISASLPVDDNFPPPPPSPREQLPALVLFFFLRASPFGSFSPTFVSKIFSFAVVFFQGTTPSADEEVPRRRGACLFSRVFSFRIIAPFWWWEVPIKSCARSLSSAEHLLLPFTSLTERNFLDLDIPPLFFPVVLSFRWSVSSTWSPLNMLFVPFQMVFPPVS